MPARVGKRRGKGEKGKRKDRHHRAAALRTKYGGDIKECMWDKMMWEDQGTGFYFKKGVALDF